MDNQNEFLALMEKVRAGSEEAAAELFRRYHSHILQVVRRKMLRKLRTKYESHDFTQAVWASFFIKRVREQTFNHPNELLAFLAAMARNKLVDATRAQFDSQKRDLERERSLDASQARRKLVSHDPQPGETVFLETSGKCCSGHCYRASAKSSFSCERERAIRR
jgi:DNA-directed RNA polymerase specialized sigma24 family protein